MKRFYLLKFVLPIAILLGLNSRAFTQTVVYSQSFTNGVTPTTQCTAWTTFCNSLLSSYIYTGFNVSGSLNTTGYTCTNATVATAIATALRTNTGTTQTSDGHTWYVSTVGACGSGCGSPGGEFAVDQGLCACGSICSVRPGIQNLNWGGMGTTCSAPSQTLTVTFFYQSITFPGGSPRTLPLVCQNSGPVSLNSLLTTSDPAAGLTATWTVNTPALHGTVGGFPVSATTGTSVTPPGTLTYTPNTGFTGIDSFNIRASDGSANAFCTIIVTVNPSPAGITGTPCVVVGGIPSQLSDPTPGGSWSSGSPTFATVSGTGLVSGVAAGTAMISYAPPGSVCPATLLVSVNTTPVAITGAPNVCTGFTTILSDASPGGTWTSSSINASVNPVGIVTGVFVGSATITYTLPTGCSAITGFTVNSQPAAITGVMNTCPGLTTTLNDVSLSGTWSSGATSIATVGAGTGVVSGITAGTASITYTLGTGCFSTASVIVNSNPATPGGATAVCAGSTAIVTDATPGGTWTSGSTSVALIGIGTGVVTGVTAGTLTLTYTLGTTGCLSTRLFQVYAQPGPIIGVPNVCVGATTALTDAGGGSWSSGTPTVATIGGGTGIVAGVTTGSTIITYTLPTGCNTTTTLIVNPLPVPYVVTGGGAYCSGPGGVHIGLTYSNSGINYQLRSGPTPVGSAVPGSNSGLDFGPETGAGCYTVTANNPMTGCNNNMTGTVCVTINPLPALHYVTGGGNICIGGAGANITLDGSDTGIKYQLYKGGTPVGPLFSGTGLPINFGLFTSPGTYTVVAINNTTGCTSLMLNNAVVTINALPIPYLVMGGGNYCVGGAGVHVYLANSDPGITYFLINGGVTVASVVSSGGTIDFGVFTATGIYTVTGNNPLTGCNNNMTGSATIVVNPLPAAYTVTGGGQYCVGSPGLHVGLSYSSTGVMYYLWFASGIIDSAGGSGTSLDFGLKMGMVTYTVAAKNLSTGCTNNMSGSVNIIINPTPNAYGVTGGGSYCFGDPGVDIGTDFSDLGVNYQLFRGATPVGTPVAGTGFILDFGLFTLTGTYSIVATDALTGCTAGMANTVTVGVNPLPIVHTVTGGGNYCSGGVGLNVLLNGSESGINYELMLNGSTMVAALSGDGAPLNFGPQTTAGIYTVVARDGTSNCTKNMAGSALININSLPIAYDVIGGGIYCAGGTGVHIGLSGSSSGISYQLINGVPSGAPMAGSGAPIDFGIRTTGGTYTVTATNLLTGCSAVMNSTASITINPLPNDYPISAGGNYCSGGSGIDVTISNSDDGINYQLYRGLLAVGSPIAGSSGIPVDFGFDTSGVYTVLATDPATTCSKRMPGSSIINKIVAAQYTVTGGGNYCIGGSGTSVMLSGSQIGWSYQLYIGGVPSGTPVAGAGTALNFGLQTSADIYTVVATNDLYTCIAPMTGSVMIGINPLPPVATVTGGGIYCAGGAGAHVGLDLPVTGINYQLYRGSSLVGSPVSGTTGTPIDFGMETATGNYSVVATDAATGCADTMTGSVTVTVRPLPAAYLTSITGENPVYPGYFCATDSGVHVYLPNSQAGVVYQLWRGGAIIGSGVPGTGSVVDLGLQVVAGTYTISGTDTTALPHCSNNMLGSVMAQIIPLPTVHNVTGGGTFCPGGIGVHVGLDGSEAGIIYSLMYNGVPTGITLPASGGPLDYGLQTLTGAYTVVGSSSITYCPNNMFGSAIAAHEVISTPTVVLHAYPGTGIDVSHVDSVRAFVTNGGPSPTYQWLLNGHVIAGATNESFTSSGLFNNDSVECKVTGSGPCGGNTTAASLVIKLHAQGVNVANVGTGSQVILMPNPNKGTFTVKGYLGTPVDEELSIEVTNMLGQVVYKNKVMSRNGNIDEQLQLRNNLANGMYILNLRSGTQNTVFHFVIEQ